MAFRESENKNVFTPSYKINRGASPPTPVCKMSPPAVELKIEMNMKR